MEFNGIINVYKEAGFTSFDVVAKLRGMLKVKKIGHTGTLDPEAVGVLPVCVGYATKICDLLTDATKEYVATMRLGVETDTQDMTGSILNEYPVDENVLTDERLLKAFEKFTGDIEQIPPMYSAIKVNGQKLYDLARKGIEVERKKRNVRIEEIELLNGFHNTANGPMIRFRVVCSKGTYIRSLCHDLGKELGCGGAMEHLERTRVGCFSSDNAYTLSSIQTIVDESKLQTSDTVEDMNLKPLMDIIEPVDAIFSEYSALNVTHEGMKALNNGNQLQPEQIKEVNEGFKLRARRVYRIYAEDGSFRALYEYHSGWKALKTVKVFSLE